MTYVLHSKSDRYCPREFSHLYYISPFTNDLRRTKVESKYVTHGLSPRQLNTVASVNLHPSVMAVAQAWDNFCMKAVRLPSLRCRQIPPDTNADTILYDVSTGLSRPVVPSAYQRLIHYADFHV